MTVHDFTHGIPAGWNTYDSKRVCRSNVVAEDEAVSLWTRPYGQEWRGGSLIWPEPFTYGSVTVVMRADKGRWTKALLMLWPAYEWPPEIDFLEMGGALNWDRHKIAVTAHYDQDNKMIHRSITADMTQWATVSVSWTPELIIVSHEDEDGPATPVVMVNPGIDNPMKVHMTYWPTHKAASDPWPVASSRMQVRWVSIEGGT